jgi:Flp pilus assembly protein TadG
MLMRRAPTSLWQDREGSAVVEGAVLVPVLFTLLLGVYEFSWFFYQQHLISTGLQDAARYLARTSNPSDSTNQSKAKNLAVYGQDTSGTERVRGWTTSYVSVSVSSVAATNCGATTPCRGGAVTLITVCTGTTTATQDCSSTSFTDPALGFFGFLGLTAPSFNVSHSERWIGTS